MMKQIKICGVPFKIKEVAVIDENAEGIVEGKIIFEKSKILLKKSLPKKMKESILYHEVLHGMLVMLGYNELSENETLVQGLSALMYQMFDFKKGASK